MERKPIICWVCILNFSLSGLNQALPDNLFACMTLPRSMLSPPHFVTGHDLSTFSEPTCVVFRFFSDSQHLHPNRPKDLSGLQSSTLFCQWQCNFLEIESEIVSVVLLKGRWKTFLRLSKALKSKSWHFEWHFRGKNRYCTLSWHFLLSAVNLCWLCLPCQWKPTAAACFITPTNRNIVHHHFAFFSCFLLYFFLHGCATIWLGIGYWTKDGKQKDTKVVDEREIESCKVLRLLVGRYDWYG